MCDCNQGNTVLCGLLPLVKHRKQRVIHPRARKEVSKTVRYYLLLIRNFGRFYFFNWERRWFHSEDETVRADVQATFFPSNYLVQSIIIEKVDENIRGSEDLPC